MKKILMSCVILALGAMQLPVHAEPPKDATNWSQASSAIENGETNWTMYVDITAPEGAYPINANHSGAIFGVSLSTLSADGKHALINNSTNLTLTGNGGVLTSGNPLIVAIYNSSLLRLNNNITIDTGISQENAGASSQLLIDGSSSFNGSGLNGSTTLNGTQNLINTGTVGFASGTTGGTLNINGGLLDSGATVDISAGNTLSVSGGVAAGNDYAGTINLDSSDTWDGTVGVAGTGTLTLNHTNNSAATSGYNQQGGTTLLTNGTTLNINGASLNLPAGSQITYGNISLDGTAGKTGNTINVNGGSIQSNGGIYNTILDLEAGNTLNISYYGAVSVGAGSTLNGAINVAGAGTLELYGGSYVSPNLHISSATLNLSNGASYEHTTGAFAGDDYVALNIGSYNGTDEQNPYFVGNTFTISGTGVLDKSVDVSLYQGNNLVIKGNAQATLDGGDTWGGQIFDPFSQQYTENANVYLSQNGTLTLDGMTKDTELDVYNQTGGTLNLINGASLTLSIPSYADVIPTALTTDGTGHGQTVVYIGSQTANDTSSLTISSPITVQTAAAGDQLAINVGTATTTGNSLNVSGGTLDSTAAVNLNRGNALNLSSGNATLNGTGAGVDNWAGNVTVTGGTLTLNGINAQSNSSYRQSAGILDVAGGATSTLSSNTLINGTSTINVGTGASTNNTLKLAGGTITGSGTTVNIGTTTAGSTGNTLTMDGSSALDETANVIINTNNNLKMQGSSLVTLDNTDTWNGNVTLASGTLTLDAMGTGTSMGRSSTFNQTGGTFNIANGTSDVVSAHYITSSNGESVVNVDGKLYLDGNSCITSGAGGLTEVNIGNSSNSRELIMNDASTATITNGTSGETIVNIGVGASTGNKLLLQAGTITGNGTVVNIGTSDSTGNVLSVEGGTLDESVSVGLFAGNTMSVSGGNATLNHNGTDDDNWYGAVDVTGYGTLTLDGVTSHGLYTQEGGTLNLTGGSTMNLSSASDIITNSQGSSVINIGFGDAGNNSVTLSAGTITSTSNLPPTTINIGGNGSNNNSLNIEGTAALEELVVVNIQANNTLNISGGSATLNGEVDGLPYNTDDTWNGNVILSDSGTLTLDGLVNSQTSSYTQTSGTLNITNGSNFELTSGSKITTLGDGSSTSTVNVGASGQSNGSAFTLGTGSTFASAANGDTLILDIGNGSTGNSVNVNGGTLGSSAWVKLTEGNNLNVYSGNATLDGQQIGKEDLWAGNVEVRGGALTLNAFTRGITDGSYTQYAGTLNLTDGASLTLSNLDSLTTNGMGGTTTVNIGTVAGSDGSSLTLSGAGSTLDIGGYGDTLVVNIGKAGVTGSSLNIEGGSVNSSATVKLYNGNALNLSSGSATLNGTGSGIDSLAGDIVVSGGTLTLSAISAQNGSTYNQSGGSTLLSHGSALTMGNLDTITSGIITLDGTTNNTGNTLNVGGNIATAAQVVLNANNTLNVLAHGNVTLNGTGTAATVDTWAGTVNVASLGTLDLKGITSNGIYNQTGGIANLDSASTLTLLDNSTLGGGTLANAGSVYLSNTGAETVATQFEGAGSIYKNAAGNSTFTADNTGFTGTYNQSAGTATIQNNLFFAGAKNLTGGTTNITTGGTLTLNSGDTWSDATVSTTGGTFNLDGFSHTTGGAYNQSSGSLVLENTSTLTTGGSITGGTVGFVGTDNILNIAAGGNFGSGAVLTLNTDNNFNVVGGTATLNAGDNWSGAGSVLVNGGTLTLDGITSNGIYTMSGGRTNLTAGTTLNYGDDSSLGGGTFNNLGTLNITNTNQNYVGSNFTGNGVINKSDTGETIFTANGQNFTGTYNQTAGTTNIQAMADSASGTFFGNAVKNFTGGDVAIASGAGLILGATDTWGATSISNEGLFALNGASHDSTTDGTFNQSNGYLILANSSLTLGAGSSITGGNVGFSGTGSTLNLSAGTSLAPDIAIGLTAGNNLTLSGGSATLNNTDTWTGNIRVTDAASTLTLDHMIHDTNISGAYNQTAGALTLTNGSALRLGSGSSITGGTISLDATTNHIGNVLDIGTGATFNPTFAFDITAGNNFNVSGGNATLDSAHTAWNGVVGISAGTLDLKDITIHGIYNQTGGITTMNTGTKLVLSDTSNLSGGILINNGRLDLTNTSDQLIRTTIGSNSSSDGTSQINKIGTGETTFAADNSGYTGTYKQTDGTALIKNNFFTGTNKFEGGVANITTGGNLILNSASSWTDTNITNNGGSFKLGTDHVASTVGTFNQSAGTTTIDSGATLSLDLAHSTLSGGRLVNNGTLDLTTTADGQTVATSLSGNSGGRIDKNGDGTLLLTGQNLGYLGNLYINHGTVDFNVDSGFTDSYISGKTYLNGGTLNLAYDRPGFFGSVIDLTSNSTLNLDTNGHTVTSLSNSITGNGTVNKSGEGAYTLFTGSNGELTYNLNVNGGSMNVVADSTATFDSAVSVNASTLRVSSSDTNFNGGLTLDHGYLNILNGGFNVNNGFSVGSTVNTMNGVALPNTITGNLNVGSSGIADFLIDISPSAANSDSYQISGAITESTSDGKVNISDFKIIGPPTLVQSVNLKIFNAVGGSAGVDFGATDKIVTSALGQYGLTSNGGGDYTLGWIDFNPQVFRGQVATEAAYANQLTTNNVLFDHINLVSQQLMSDEKANVYAGENPQYAPYQYSAKDGGLWYKAFGNLERLQLSQNINTQNNMWGSLVGADFPVVQLKHGWKCLPTAYIGYTGSHQAYSGVSMYQNGGQGGIMGTFYKGDFMTSLLANVGGYANDMSVEGTTDRTGNWFAGVASKSAYNIRLPKDFILQPSMMMSYNAFGQQNWNSNFGDVGLTSSMLNGLNLAPGLNLIYNKETWSVYATTQLMFNLSNGVSGTVGNVDLPTVKMGSTYFQYGLGVTKRIKDRLSLYGQIVMSNGVRTGVGFQGGLQWKF